MKKLRSLVSLIAALAIAVSLCGVVPTQAAGGDFVVTDGVLLAYHGPGGDVTIPDGVTAIGERAFYRNQAVTSVIIPDGVTSVGMNAFYSCQNLKEVQLPNTLTTLYPHAFSMCSSLAEIDLPASLTHLGDHAFYQCDSLTEVDIPGSVKTVSEYAFYGCDQLTSAELRYGVEKIEAAAFMDSANFAHLTIPSSVTFIGALVLNGCADRITVYGYNGTEAKDFAIGYAWNGVEFVALDGKNPFTDVKEADYFADPVLWAVEERITNGTSATTFAPNQTCTTAQILTFLWRAAGQPLVRYDGLFVDVPEESYYFEAAHWAKWLGMVSGDTLSPDSPCTRAATVQYLWKAAGSPDASAQVSFTDVPANASYAEAVAWAVETGVTTGTSATTFTPDATCTRGQIATFLYRAFAD